MIYKDEYKNTIERDIIDYISIGKEKLENEFGSTKDALELIASETTKEFLNGIDKSLSTFNKEQLNILIKISMYKAFCFGYSIGKIENKDDIELFL